MKNRLGNCKNRFQGPYWKVLCVCSAGMLRSPSAAIVLSQYPFNFNTRAAGLDKEFALIPVDDVLLTWADEIVCMSKLQEVDLKRQLELAGESKGVINLDIPDEFDYRDKKLMVLIEKNYRAAKERREEV